MHINDRIQDFTYYMKFISSVISGEKYDAPTLIKGVFNPVYFPAIEFIMLESDEEAELKTLFSKLRSILLPYFRDIIKENVSISYSENQYDPFLRINYINPYTQIEEEIALIDLRERAFMIKKNEEIANREYELENLKKEKEELLKTKDEVVDRYDPKKATDIFSLTERTLFKKSNFKEGMQDLKVIDEEINNINLAIREVEIEIQAIFRENQEINSLKENVRKGLILSSALRDGGEY